MKYKGIELKEITEPQIFDPPKKMLVWDSDRTPFTDDIPNLCKQEVIAILPKVFANNIVLAIHPDNRYSHHMHCAEIPEEPKPRMATWKELAYWLMDGKGLVVDENTSRVDTGVFFNRVDLDAEVSDNLKVMRRDDTEWHEPTAEYMGIEETK